MEFYENSQEPEVAVLVGIDMGLYNAQVSMDELEELARTAGAVVAAKIIQKRDKPDSATYVGSGRLEEIKSFTEANDVDLLIFDGELTPSQQRNIEDETDIRVIDRTTLILDIFAARARSNEGKIQVELAQLKYSLPRLGGKGAEMSRLGGGIGTRGPGESKLESDRRHIHRRIQSLQEELVQIAKRRENLRARREKDGIETVAIVGYTNAGKSTLMNTLTNAGVLAENKLFATLDPTSRALTLPDGRTVMLIDTVGLVRRLPHQLVDAFRSTLEEAANATVILNLCDASDECCTEHLNVTMNLLAALGCADKPIISVLNKCDLCGGSFVLPAQGEFVMISAKTGEGLGNLLAKIQLSLPPTRRKAELLIPYNEGGLVSYIREEGVLIKEDYRADGIYVKAVVDIQFLDKHKDLIV
ncbi:MAG: GTPase HflX [Oscillospiraceae bacterium]|nr:GTPase HflX [Oscillospiraceae bacterium]MCI6928371.1 GTPase HflX [Ruminococcus sp.]MDY3088828.1 GTPase HflX [Oscillospiraceae bacterium]